MVYGLSKLTGINLWNGMWSNVEKKRWGCNRDHDTNMIGGRLRGRVYCVPYALNSWKEYAICVVNIACSRRGREREREDKFGNTNEMRSKEDVGGQNSRAYHARKPQHAPHLTATNASLEA